MLNGFVVLCLFALWQIANVQAIFDNFDPRYIHRIDNQLKKYANSQCDYRCRDEPDDCSHESRNDLHTCGDRLYRAYWNNYKVCRAKCATEVSSACKIYTDCTEACLKVGSNKLRFNSKTPDELIHLANLHFEKGIYIE